MPLVGKLAGALGLATVLWLWVDWREAAQALTGADLDLLTLAFAASVASVALSACKWQGLLERIGLRLGLGLSARLYWIGCFFSNFLPTGVGGDAVRLLLTPAKGRLTEVAGTILVERLTGLLVMLLLAAAGLALQPLGLADAWFERLLLATVLALAAGVATLLLMPRLFLRALDRAAALAPRVLAPRASRAPLAWAREVAGGVVGPACDLGSVVWAVLVSIPFYAANILAQFLLLRAVGAELGLPQAALAAPVVLLVGLLPVSVNGLVLAEGAFVVVYASAGVPPELALAAAILRRLVDLANSGAGGLLWLGWQGEGGTAAGAAAPGGGATRTGWRRAAAGCGAGGAGGGVRGPVF